MTNRRSYHQEREKVARWVQLPEYMLASPAWQSLDGNSRAIYVEIARRYRGPNSNNGRIPYSVREAASALRIGTSTANRALHALIDRGFTRIAKHSGFNMKGRVATEWLLTAYPDDTAGSIATATKDFMRWENTKHSATTDTDGATSGTHRCL